MRTLAATLGNRVRARSASDASAVRASSASSGWRGSSPRSAIVHDDHTRLGAECLLKLGERLVAANLQLGGKVRDLVANRFASGRWLLRSCLGLLGQ